MPQSPPDLESDDAAADALARFRSLVFADPPLASELASIEYPDLFVARCLALAEVAGLPVEPLGEALQSSLAASARAPTLLTHHTAPMPGWLPIAVSDAEIDWTWFGDAPLTAPFFDESMQRVRSRPFNRVFRLRTPIGELHRWRALPHLQPSGLIFHMSRCGSTLAAQMLASVERHIAISEAPAIEAMVRRGDAEGLRVMAAALGQRRRGDERAYVIKLDCWHIRSFDLFRRAFPETPWVFLYRDPVEVLVSHQLQAGRQMVPAIVPPATFGLTHPDVPDTDYRARLLASLLTAAADAYGQGGGKLIHYREMPDALFDPLLAHFGIDPTPVESARMAEAARRDAKAPETGFTPDAARKRAAATPDILAVCAAHLDAPYAALEALRARD